MQRKYIKITNISLRSSFLFPGPKLIVIVVAPNAFQNGQMQIFNVILVVVVTMMVASFQRK
jgi:hypothetical protein